MDEEKIQDDFRVYKERNWFQRIQKPFLLVYVLLGVSFLLIAIYFIVAFSKVATLSSDVNEMYTEFPVIPSDGDFQLFPCGPDRRQWEYFNGMCYYFSLEKTGWMRAKAGCIERQSQLVIINSMAEQNFLQTRTRNDRYWIGLTDADVEGVWQWLDGSNYRAGFTYWKPGEPNNDGANEHCAHLWGNGEWNDVYCTYQCYYICEKPLPRARPKQEGT